MHLAVDLIKSTDINCVLFAFLILKKAEEKLISLRDEAINIYEYKELAGCLNSELKEISVELAKYSMNENLTNWKTLVRATGEFHRNFRAFYMMVAYLANEVPRDDLSIG